MKKCLLPEINTITKFLLFKMKYIGLFIWLLTQVITLISQSANQLKSSGANELIREWIDVSHKLKIKF